MPDMQRLSKFLSYVLRHAPEKVGLQLDEQGWADVDELIEACRKKNKPLDRATLEKIVATDSKGRYSFSDDGRRIRANQGHSIRVDLQLKEATPPDRLFQGTVARFLDPIREEGLKKMGRHHVHLSVDRATAVNVGSRRGKPVILVIRAREMHDAGHKFYLSDNGVWLTDHVPVEFIEFPET